MSLSVHGNCKFNDISRLMVCGHTLILCIALMGSGGLAFDGMWVSAKRVHRFHLKAFVKFRGFTLRVVYRECLVCPW